MSFEDVIRVAQAKTAADRLLRVCREVARLIKGYGDTHKRGSTNYALIESRIVQPALAGRIPVRQAIDAIASARTAALADPEGDALTRCLTEVEQQATLGIAAE
jgi:indolepyruvate ferredoxin oxidoreductase, beta subunit